MPGGIHWEGGTVRALCCFPLVFAGSSCAIETITVLLLYIPVLPSCILTAVLLLNLYLLFCLVLILSNLAYLLIIFSLFVYQSCF